VERAARRLRSWDSELGEFRKGKDAFYQASEDSPIPRDQRHLFLGLKYFVPDLKLRFETKLHRYESPDTVTMSTSKGTQQRFHRIGYFELEIAGGVLKVQAYKSAEREDSDVFVPFRDATSGKESYGSARYLDLEERADDNYVVDFNYSYNPYCAYSEDYICPLPPKENWLEVAIRAGEMKYHD
jgi:uncharacterized protein